jgi:drug/metabolite transporter (DMT)-like permease
LVWSTGGLIVRLIEHADSWTIVFWRSVTAVLFLAAYIQLRNGGRVFQHFADLRWPSFAVGFCFCCASLSLVIALKLTAVANVLLIMSSSPVMAAGMGRMVLRERVSGSTSLSIAATVVGILLIAWQSFETEAPTARWGNVFALAIAFSYASAIVLIRLHPATQMTPAVLLGMVLATAAVTPLASPWSVTLRDAGLMVLFGAFNLGLGLALFVAGARLIPAAHTALLGTLEPLAGPFWVWLVLDEQPARLTLLGGAIILASLLWHTLSQLRRLR